MENTNNNGFHYEKDKNLAPYLLTCPDILYHGTEREGDTVYFKFTPIELVDKAIDSYYSRTANLIQPKDFCDNIERFKNEIFQVMKRRI
ncbi:MAG: hypothetical protein AAB546_00155 [Patescibacteria group bacterium]